MHTGHFWMQLPRSMKDKIHLAGFNALLSGDSSRVDLLPGLTMPCGRSGSPSRRQPFHAGRFSSRTLFLWPYSLLWVTGCMAPLRIPWPYIVIPTQWPCYTKQRRTLRLNVTLPRLAMLSHWLLTNLMVDHTLKLPINEVF